MKKPILTLAAAILISGNLAAQELFTGVGAKGYYNKVLKGQDAFYIPQFQIGFETYSETAQVVQEGKLSKLQNTFEAHSKGGQYAGGQKGSAKVTTILDAGLSLEDFQTLANDFQSILENEIEKSGFKVLRMSEVDGMESFGKIKEKFDNKTDKKQGKASSDDIGTGTVKVMPDLTIFMFDEKSVMKGGGPAFYTMLKKTHAETNATMILQNLNVDFSTVELDVQLDAGRKGKTTTAEMKVLPKMRISSNSFDFIGPKGGPSSAPASLNGEFVSDKEYNARIYSDKKKAESLFSQWFSLKSKPSVDFDPRIVEITREDYMTAARDLFTQYSQSFANTLVVGAGGK
ncbi:hypothetical protein [Arthrospiribacter ruber]|uniref:Uncharacterized protein n=1 Tax=Arthrospiribacter ruber TaxID=2487934 RepID=A0A951IZ57_9BACT|nr:hypothetical protein [Arthrospiribacter ruber]MBW3468974.1 hypothetical protein [Arthrospiribacter ruber]